MLEGMKPVQRVFVCAVNRIKDTLSDNDQQILMAAINDADTWPAKTLDRALRQRGVVLSDSAITNHRRKGCACWKN